MSAVPQPDGDVSWPRPTSTFIGQQVRIGDVAVGRIRDVLVNRGFGHVLGFVVDGRGAHRHFLPWVAAEFETDHVQAKSVFALLSTSELAFYVDNGESLARDGQPEMLVERDGDTVSDSSGLGRTPPPLAGVGTKAVSD